MSALRLAWLRLTGCAGCQLSLLNAEQSLAAAAGLLEVCDFPLLSSAIEGSGELDVALVEGALSTPDELNELLALRRRAPVLIAVGACAVSGGIPALAGDRRSARVSEVYGEPGPGASFPPQPLSRFVDVEFEIPGCPPEADELFATLASLARHGLPQQLQPPVCFECRRRENLCLLFETSPRQPCMGPVTRSGCRARCPSLGIGCEGCRGRLPAARREQLQAVLTAGELCQHACHALSRRFGEPSP